MEISLSFFLLLYCVPLIIFLVMSIVNAYHISRFGAFDARNKTLVTIYGLIVLAVLAGVVLYLAPVDWSESFSLVFPSFSFFGR